MTRTELINKANEAYWHWESYHKEERLATCSAWYKDLGNYVVLRSYNTIVALYYKPTGTCYVFDYWSATTTQHCWKFARLMNADRMTFLYEKSNHIIEQALWEYANTIKLPARNVKKED